MNSNKLNQITSSKKTVLNHCDSDDCNTENEKKDKFRDNLLREHRTLIISEEISSKVAKTIIPQLLWLDKQSLEPIKLFINTPGGGADDGFAIHDIIRFIKSPVYAVCNGLTASAGTIILLGAPLKQRLTFPNSRIMLHQPAGGTRGQASDIEITAAEIVKLRERANKLISKSVKKPSKKWKKTQTVTSGSLLKKRVNTSYAQRLLLLLMI